MKNAYTKSESEILSSLSVSKEQGLSQEEVKDRLTKYGENKLQETDGKTIWQILLEQFKDVMIIILIIAAGISMALGEWIEGVIILAIVVLNAILGTYQENKAGKALAALKQMSSPKAKVIRNGQNMEVASTELVPGDIVILETGDYVPADVYLLESINLKIDEAALTGESVPVEKDSNVSVEEGVPLGDRFNMAYMSTIVTYGRGKAVVVGTGMETEIGHIANMLNQATEEKTPLQKNLEGFGKILGMICIVVAIVIFILGMMQGMKPLDIFMTAVALAVAAIPEGLPAVVTVVLAMGMTRMVKRNAIMKQLSAAETLGSTSVICSDKTGTLTQNKMTVVSLFDGETIYEVTGTGYYPEGDILDAKGEKVDVKNNPSLKWVATIAGLCNDAKVEDGAVIGDPTEGALITLANKAGCLVETLNNKHIRIKEFPFDSDRKLMSTMHEIDGKTYLLTKGAPDQLIARATEYMKDNQILSLTEEVRERLLAQNTNYAKQALRVLGYAFREVAKDAVPEENENNLVFVGLSGMIDPPREEAKAAIAVAKEAGIRAVMITGDHLITATAIGKDLGIIERDDQAMEGAKINDLSDKELQEKVMQTNVFARVSPEHKVRIVDAIQANGLVAAMTGDGVNDAPALKKADIGIAMGITGTDVSKEAANMILTDDNFASIVAAVEEGRIIYSNIRKLVNFLLSCNIGEILIIFVAMLFGWGTPLAATQILWINLLTDSFPAFSLGLEKGEKGIMKEKPRDKHAPLLDKRMTRALAIQSVGLAAATLFSYRLGDSFGGHELATTFCFTTLIIAEMLRAYSARSETENIWNMNPFSNNYLNLSAFLGIGLLMVVLYVPALNTIFKTVPLSLTHLLYAAGLAVVPMVVAEIGKIIGRAMEGKNA
ncbi:MAG: cation-translocating P-type ATPase [Eubacteriales bacterium]|nr:cation-translocating P-type ATPase [Eubacteriales bacterium]